jgi:hypothetical protein
MDLPMRNQGISRSENERDQSPTEREDARWQAAVLGLVLTEHPHQLSKHELECEVLGLNPSLPERDACQRAIDDLARVGLLRSCEEVILVTRPALRFSELGLG